MLPIGPVFLFRLMLMLMLMLLMQVLVVRRIGPGMLVGQCSCLC